MNEKDDVASQVDLLTIRKTLEREITSKQKSIDRLLKFRYFDAAAREDTVQEGLKWALFVLAKECNI